MKTKLHTPSLLSLLLLAFLLMASDCDKENLSPLEQLPPATQTGAFTFGCLINGEAFLPSGNPLGGPVLSAFYIQSNGTYTMNISGKKGGGENLERISIGALDIEALTEGVYPLVSEASGNLFGKYKLGLDSSYTTDEAPGTLTITHLDTQVGIISGTFEFTVTDNEGKQIAITDGRFDMLYTN